MSGECDKCSEHALECECYERCKCGKHPATHPDEFNMLICELGMFDAVLEQEIDATCKVCNDKFLFKRKKLEHHRSVPNQKNIMEWRRNEQSMRKNKKLLVLTLLIILSIPHFFYRFRHPEMTETQLFLNFFKSYKEIFHREDDQ